MFSAECVCLKPVSFFSDLSRLSYIYHENMHIMHLVEMCVCVCPRDDLKTADICFLLGRCVDRKISDEFACQDNRSMSRSFVREFKVTR